MGVCYSCLGSHDQGLEAVKEPAGVPSPPLTILIPQLQVGHVQNAHEGPPILQDDEGFESPHSQLSRFSCASSAWHMELVSCRESFTSGVLDFSPRTSRHTASCILAESHTDILLDVHAPSPQHEPTQQHGSTQQGAAIQQHTSTQPHAPAQPHAPTQQHTADRPEFRTHAAHADKLGAAHAAVQLNALASEQKEGETWPSPGLPSVIQPVACRLETLRAMVAKYHQFSGPCLALEGLLRHCEDTHDTPEELKPLVADLVGMSAEDQAMLRRLLRSADAIQPAIRNALDDTGWKVVRNDGLKLGYRHEHGSTTHDFKGCCELDAPVEHLLALAREFDLSKTWNKYLLEAVFLEQLSPAEVVILAVMWMPWPIQPMCMVIEAVGADLLKTHGGFLAMLQTSTMPLPPKMPGNHHKQMHHLKVQPGSCFFFEPLPPLQLGGPQRSRACLVIRADPGLKHVPEFLNSFVLKVFAPFLWSIASKLFETEFSNPTRPIPTRISDNKPFYASVVARATSFLAANALPPV